MPASQSDILDEVHRTLDENDLRHFQEVVSHAVDQGININLPYKSAGNKTILQLAFEEEDGEPYIDHLLSVSSKSCCVGSHIFLPT